MPQSILVIDDDKDDLFFFGKAAKDLFPELTLHLFDVCETALDFLRKSDGQRYPDIVFLDINMPIKNGWECLREIKNITTDKHLPIVMYSTSRFDPMGVTPADVGASAFLTKADTIPALKVKLKEILGRLLPS